MERLGEEFHERPKGRSGAEEGTAEVIGHDELLALLVPTALEKRVAVPLPRASKSGVLGERRRTRMDCFAGLDVSIDETAIAIQSREDLRAFTATHPRPEHALQGDEAVDQAWQSYLEQ